MSKPEFDKAIAALQEIQKRVTWDDPRKRGAHDEIRALALKFKGVDIGEFDA